MPILFRHSICNEMYGTRDFAETCRAIRLAGYAGIEIAPFTLAEEPAAITRAARVECREMIACEGLEFAGLHWLMVAPKGLHVTTPDRALRERSWKHIASLIELCADLRAADRDSGGILVFGSPKQRNITGGISREEATRHYVDGLAGLAALAEERGVTVLVEALPRNQSDIVNSLAEAAAIVRQIGSPGVQTMFDTHNAVDETEPHDALIDRYFDLIRHVHVNEMDGRHPGTGNYDFKPLLRALLNREYARWISLEVFDFSLGADTIARDSLRFLKGEIQKLNA
ncbi:MAG: sugar phosphate isomerase/epimerase family protein [Bryobacteraceae bacterium]